MTAPRSRLRDSADACPGVARPFTAVDGSIVRLRPAGQPVSVSALAQLLDVVAGQDDPSILLTSRAALQLRGLPNPLTDEVRASITATGLVPRPSHELVRNVVASPLSGLDGAGQCDVRPVVAALDEALCADPGLSRLGGRFLFAVDDGRGDVIGSTFDLGFLATGRESGFVLAGSSSRGWAVPLGQAVPALLELAHEFAVRTQGGVTAWHVDELAEPLGSGPTAVVTPPPARARPLGAVGEHAVVAVPLGLLRRQHVNALARVTDAVRVTPWRSLVVENAARHLPVLEAAGLATHDGSPWHRLHACTGLPGCRRSAVDTQALAHAIAPDLPPGALPVHISGCERRCGTPATAYVDLLTPPTVDAALATIHATPQSRVPTSPHQGAAHTGPQSRVPTSRPPGTEHSTGPGPSGSGHSTGPGPLGSGHSTGPRPSGTGHSTGPRPSGTGHSTGLGASGSGHSTGGTERSWT